MAKKGQESVKLRRGITRNGELKEAGEKIDVPDWEKRQLIASGYVDGDDIDTAPTEALKEQYKEASKGWEKRGDMDVFSVDKAAEEGDGYGDPSDAPQEEQGQRSSQQQG